MTDEKKCLRELTEDICRKLGLTQVGFDGKDECIAIVERGLEAALTEALKARDEARQQLEAKSGAMPLELVDRSAELYKKRINRLTEELRWCRDALAFYADRNNWERIEGHTKWASNLNKPDCAMLNCGGGRARLALAELDAEGGSSE